MPRIKLTKSAIDALPSPSSDAVYRDIGCPGFGVKVTPMGRRVFVVLYRTGGAGPKLRKHTIGPYGRVTLHQAQVAASNVFAVTLEGRDPPAGWRLHDLRRICVPGMARVGIAPHGADKILKQQAGTISAVAAIGQRHEFRAERHSFHV
jgi:hypothetical protein